ncbi:MAG: hypothetical protein ACNI25_03690 [Halarcobacter sp.]
MDNKIDKIEFVKQLKKSESKFFVSSRFLDEDMDLDIYLKFFYPYLRLEQIESIYGFALQLSSLYGGRSYKKGTLATKKHLNQLKKLNINFSLTLTNHYFSDEAFEESFELLEYLHKHGNSITVTNNKLVKKIKEFFPLFTYKASLIKHLDSLEKVNNALKIYDYIVVPMDKNDDDIFLNSLPYKERIILFINANCAYNCPSRICYTSISKSLSNRQDSSNFDCSIYNIPRKNLGHIFFNLKKFENMGFSNFKLVPQYSEKLIGMVRNFSKKN